MVVAGRRLVEIDARAGRSEERAFGGKERLVEQVDDGGCEAEAVDDLADEGGAGGVLGGKGGADAPLPAENEIDGRVVGEEALGGAGEGLAVDGLHEPAEAGGGEVATELGVAGAAGAGEVAADGEELVALGHVDAGGDGDLGGADVAVEASAGGLFEAGAGPPGGGVGLVGALVFGEADVAVDAHEALVRGADVGGGEKEHRLVDLGEDGEHGGFELLLVDVPAGFEPGAVVVAFEAAEEFEGGFVEVGGHRGMVVGSVGWRVCGARSDGGFGAVLSVEFAFGRVEPTHVAMRLRHGWGTRASRRQSSFFNVDASGSGVCARSGYT